MEPNGNQLQKGLYRSRTGMIAGVCKGLAENWDFPVFWLRVIVVAAVLFTGVTFPLAILAYVVAAFVMKPEPIIPFSTGSDREFYDSYASSRSLGIDRLQRTYDALDRRISRIESIVTSRDFQWKRRMEE